MNDDNTVQYRIPECTEIMFTVFPQETRLSLKLLEGGAQFCVADTLVDLRVGQEFVLPALQFITLVLKSRTGCDVMIQGQHYLRIAATKVGEAYKYLYGSSPTGCGSFPFVIEKGTHLQIFVSDMASQFDVSIESICGAPEMRGNLLLPGKRYPLMRCSSVLVNSSNDESCTVCIYGVKRRIKVSLTEERTWTFMRYAHHRLRALRIQAMKNKSVGPTVLVIGPENAGKTSFCHFLISRAFNDGMSPMHIDLDICRNSNIIPGAISLVEVLGGHTDTPPNYFQGALQLGSSKLDSSNIQLYHLLIRRMGKMLKERLAESDTQYSGAVIDMFGPLARVKSAINRVLQSFAIDLVVVIDEKRYYDCLKHSLLRTMESEFIPLPQNIEPRNEIREATIRKYNLKSYFYGGEASLVFEAKFSDFKIYRIVSDSPYRKASEAEITDLNILPVKWNPSIEYYVLGVSYATSVDERLPVTEIKCFIFFTKVDMENETVTVLSPVDVGTGKILIKGDIRMI